MPSPVMGSARAAASPTRPTGRRRPRGWSADRPRATGWCARSARPRRRPGPGRRAHLRLQPVDHPRVGTRGQRRADPHADVVAAAGRARGNPPAPGVKRTTMSESPRANQPAAMVSRAGGVGDSSVRRTRLPAPSAPTTTSNVSSRPRGGAHASGRVDARSRARPRGGPPPRRPAAAARRRGRAARRSPTGRASATSTESPVAGVEAAPSTPAHGQGIGGGRGRQEAQGLGGEAAAARLLARVGGVEDA